MCNNMSEKDTEDCINLNWEIKDREREEEQMRKKVRDVEKNSTLQASSKTLICCVVDWIELQNIKKY